MADEAQKFEEGPIKIIDPEEVPKESPPMYEGYEWVTMDLNEEEQVRSALSALGDSTDTRIVERSVRASDGTLR